MTAAEDSGKVTSENPYHDRIEGDVLIYTAQGRQGDQLLSGRNKRLIEQYSTPAPFFGFINVGRQTYRFLGLLELLRHYEEQQSDRRGNLRKAWMFEFRIHSTPPIVPIEHATFISAELLAESRKQNPLVALEREVSDLDEGSFSLAADAPAAQVEDVRSHLLQIDPFRFEHLVKAVMERNGFVAVSVTQAGGDGGIDINAYVDEQNDFFAGTHVQAQVKRWRHVVGSVEINKFRGAMSSSAKGVFVTTGHYSRAAILEARIESKPTVALIDGGKLSALILRSKLDIASFR